VKLTGVITREIGGLPLAVGPRNRKEVSSPVGIVEGSSEALSQGAQTVPLGARLLSLSLALLNLLPFLPLDGGHIVFSLIEGIRGRAVGREVYERASAIGIAVVLFSSSSGSRTTSATWGTDGERTVDRRWRRQIGGGAPSSCSR
jgi:membrane-associated protease RseP (regulator of RpoE activity)